LLRSLIFRRIKAGDGRPEFCYCGRARISANYPSLFLVIVYIKASVTLAGLKG